MQRGDVETGVRSRPIGNSFRLPEQVLLSAYAQPTKISRRHSPRTVSAASGSQACSLVQAGSAAPGRHDRDHPSWAPSPQQDPQERTRQLCRHECGDPPPRQAMTAVLR